MSFCLSDLLDARDRAGYDRLTIREMHELMREHEDELRRREVEGEWPVPESAEEPDVEDQELLEVLLCPSCDMELRSEPCSPVHALLQDNPLQHRLLLPLLEKAVRELRTTETKICPKCKIPIATEDCPHATDRFGQIWVSKMTWESLNQQLEQVRNDLDELGELHGAFIESVAEERDREKEDRVRWAAEKFDAACTDPAWKNHVPTPEWQAMFRKMLEDR